MRKRIGILTSGGDCQSLNATMRGFAKAMYRQEPDTCIYGFVNGYWGLMYNEYIEMAPFWGQAVKALNICPNRMKTEWIKLN